MKVGGLQKLSLSDFPDRVAGVIFSRGCNLRCKYCHNPALVFPEGPETVSWETVVSFFTYRQGKLDGAVFSGGEPLLQDDLAEAASQLRALGFAIKIDTNGLRPERLAALLRQGLVDYVAMDIKAPAEGYLSLTGVAVDHQILRESIRLVMDAGVAYEFRTTWLPGFHTIPMLDEILRLIEGACLYALQNLSGFPTLDPAVGGVRPLTRHEMETLQAFAAPHVQCCVVRNV